MNGHPISHYEVWRPVRVDRAVAGSVKRDRIAVHCHNLDVPDNPWIWRSHLFSFLHLQVRCIPIRADSFLCICEAHLISTDLRTEIILKFIFFMESRFGL